MFYIYICMEVNIPLYVKIIKKLNKYDNKGKACN